MALNENPHPSPISRRATETSPTMGDKEPHTYISVPLETNRVTSNSMSSIPSIRSSKSKHTLSNVLKSAHSFPRIDKTATELAMMNISYRLRIRKILHTRLALVSDVMCIFGIFGVVLMIIENELKFHRVDSTETKASWFIKLIISISTAILLILICYYHSVDLKFYANQNALVNWGIGLTKTKFCFIMVELLLCAVHPMPRSYVHSDTEPVNSNSTVSSVTVPEPHPLSYIEVDVGLGLPMFCRVYLLARPIMFHSSLLRDASIQSIGYLNQVSINFFFVIKTYLERWPTRCLVGCCALVFLIGSWCLRASNYTAIGEHFSMTDSMWLFVETFTTVGYGDLYPSTHCGRCIAALIGLIGILSSALVIAILAQKLLLSREEKYVHTFVLNMELAKNRQHQAANIVKFAMKAWFLKRKKKPENIRCFRSQQKLFTSIRLLKQIKQDQGGLTDNCVGLHELMNIERNTSDQTNETVEQIRTMKADINKIEEKLNKMDQSMDMLQNTLNVLLDKITKQ